MLKEPQVRLYSKVLEARPMSFLRNITRLGMAGILCSGASQVHAQAVFGSIYGTVQDASGAVVPNATITITDAAKGIAVTEK